jgi:hypothetical protein
VVPRLRFGQSVPTPAQSSEQGNRKRTIAAINTPAYLSSRLGSNSAHSIALAKDYIDFCFRCEWFGSKVRFEEMMAHALTAQTHPVSSDFPPPSGTDNLGVDNVAS